MNKNPAEKRSRRWTFGEIIAVVLVLLIVGYTAVQAVYHVYYTGEARIVLADARMVRVAIIAVSRSSYAAHETISDSTSESGLTPEAEAKVRELSECRGKFVLLRTEEDGYGVGAMLYISDGYTAYYDTNSENSEMPWKVIKTQTLIP